MKQFLPARPFLPTVLLLLLALLGRPALATHLLGGELTYRYVDNAGPAAAPLRYELTVTVYNNCASTNPAPSAPYPTATVGIYSQATGARLVLTTTNYAGITGGNLLIPQTTLSNCITPDIPPGCIITGPSQPFKVQKFIALINLPTQPVGQGFYAVYSESARNAGIANLVGSGGLNFELYTVMTPPAIFNRSPVFVNQAVALICAGDTSYYLNNAVDADGDRLEYSFGQPNAGGLAAAFSFPQPAVPYAAGYSAGAPFGTGRGAISHLDTSTGIATYATPNQGQYSVAVDVREYRVINGVEQLIGTTRRDVQLVVTTCPPVPAPVLPPATGPNALVRDYVIEAGTTQTIPITVAQRTNNPLTLTVSSELLDGVGGYNATLNGSPGTAIGLTGAVVTTGNGTVAGTFVYSASCTEVRTAPYDINVEVRDNGCAGKTIYDAFRITVVNPAGPKTITGDAAVCVGNAPSSYTAGGGASGSTPGVTWSVTGGTIVGSSTANPVQVQWGAVGTGTLTVRGVSTAGCLSDAVTKSVTIGTAAPLAVAGNLSVCAGSSTTITVSGAGAGATYTVTGGPVTGSGTTFVLTPTATTTYTVASAATPTTCASTTQVTITVSPAPTLAVAGNLSICAGSSTTITVSGAGAGATYTVTGGPVTGSGTTFVLTPTATTTYTVANVAPAGSCAGTAQVTITVNPPVTLAVAGNRAICAGSSTTITVSGAGVGATYTVTGGPVAGSGTTFVLTPTATTTYTVASAAPAGGCAGTAQVVVTVNPTVVAAAGPAVATTSGQPVAIGAAPVAGYTYSWSPATGLSSPTAANPSVTLTNTTSAPITQTYTLTTTNAATGCSGTASVVVTVNATLVVAPVDPTLVFYNIITPNGDGLNDKLQIKNAASYPGSTVEIYNRWGRQVFATNSYDNNTNYWGADPSITSGTYYYIFKQANGATTKGWVQVVK
ncbi:MAG: gliding motility-associated C-terminal domain-containing protein [Cytophagaceae bacterium]|nr:MAG: gliding motility-associated C-terminal domain-containing protein [Cytophagaceae bacterium]